MRRDLYSPNSGGQSFHIRAIGNLGIGLQSRRQIGPRLRQAVQTGVSHGCVNQDIGVLRLQTGGPVEMRQRRRRVSQFEMHPTQRVDDRRRLTGEPIRAFGKRQRVLRRALPISQHKREIVEGDDVVRFDRDNGLVPRDRLIDVSTRFGGLRQLKLSGGEFRLERGRSNEQRLPNT